MPTQWYWDPDKEKAVRHRHGISFREAESALRDPLKVTEPDDDHSNPFEQRYRTTGQTENGRTIIVVHTRDPETGVGIIITAFDPSPQERRQYEEQ